MNRFHWTTHNDTYMSRLMNTVKVALCQIKVGADKGLNIENAAKALDISAVNSDLLVSPFVLLKIVFFLIFVDA
jgi:hypothetical protein